MDGWTGIEITSSGKIRGMSEHDEKPEPEPNQPEEQNGKPRLPKGTFSLGQWCITIFQGLIEVFSAHP